MAGYQNSFLRAADSEEIAGNGNSLEDSYADYAIYGTLSALTSAAIGFYNTGVGFADALGADVDDLYADESNAVRNVWGNEAAGFYDRHKEGVDLVGFIAGSFIPGGLAIKALRAAQTAGKLTKGLELASGMKKADLVLGSKQVRQATEAVLNNSSWNPRNPARWRAYARGYSQQLMEAGVAEVAVITTSNQNAAVNGDDLGYFQAFGSQLIASAPYVAGGGVFAGALETMRIRGHIKRAWNKEWDRTAELRSPKLPAMLGMTPGDKLSILSRKLEDFRHAPEYAVEEGDNFALKAKKHGDNIIRTEIERALIEANEGARDTTGIEMIFKELAGDEAGHINLEKFDSLVSGLTHIKNYNPKLGESMRQFYSKGNTNSFAIMLQNVGKEGWLGENVDSLNQLSTYLFDQVKHLDGMGELTREQFHNRMVKNLWSKRTPTQGEAFPHTGPSIVAPDEGKRLYTADTYLLSHGVVLPGLLVDTASVSKQGTYQNLTNSLRETMGLPKVSPEEFQEIVSLHELAHARYNLPGQIKPFWQKFGDARGGGMKGKSARKFVEQAIKLSETHRGSSWKLAEDAGVFDILHKAFPGANRYELLAGLAYKYETNGMDKLIDDIQFKKGILLTDAEQRAMKTMSYLLSPYELIADSFAMLAHPKFAEESAKLAPKLAKFNNEYGGLAKAFSPTRAYQNVRTGQTLRSHLPGVNDFGKLSFNKNGVSVKGLNRVFKRNADRFKELFNSTGKLPDGFKGVNDYLEFSAQFAIAQQSKLEDLFLTNAAGDYIVREWDIAGIERLVTENIPDEDFAVQLGKELLHGASGKDILERRLQDAKLRMRGSMVFEGAEKYSNEEIAHILNMDIDRANGFLEGELNLMGVRDFTKPEVLVLDYTNQLPKDYKGAAHSYQQTTERARILEDMHQKAAATVLEDGYNLLPEHNFLTADMATSVSQTETRRGFINSLRTDFGKAREAAAYVGQIVRKIKTQRNDEVVQDFANYFSLFNAPNAHKERMELAIASNLMTRDWYKMVKGVDADGNTIRFMAKRDIIDDPTFWGVEKVDDIPNYLDLTAEGVEAIRRNLDQKTQNVVEFSEHVGSFFEMHQRRNAKMVAKAKALAEAKGLHYAVDPSMLYAPPRDLRKTKHFAFVVPTKFMQGADRRKFMVYGTTPEELALKQQKILEKYGKEYKVLSNDKVKEFKNLMQEYDKGLVFDELSFDQGMFRTGTAAEIQPNIDLAGSYTLERFRNWHHRKEEYLINSATELKFAGFEQQLKRMDEEFATFSKSTLFKQEQQSSIWEDTRKLMIDEQSTGTEMEQMWTRVNDFIGEQGSAVLGPALDQLAKPVTKALDSVGSLFGRESNAPVKITQQKLDEFNQTLAEQGYNPPFEKLAEALIASPNLQDSRIVPSLVKTMNNLTSTMMLRLDFANNILQVMSSPILLAPVLKEAKESLRGSHRYDELVDLTTTTQPDTGLREPSISKLIGNSIRRFFSDEGKQFLSELRDRGLVSDYINEYVDATDFSMLNGRHNLAAVNHKIENLARIGGKFTKFQFAEEFTRFLAADAVRQIGEIRGLNADEIFAAAGGAIDKVHGVYRNTQRVGLFQGPLGQTVGLYQTYMFNFVQNALRWSEDPSRRKLAMQAALQGGLFGVQSFPGFQFLNSQIGKANADSNFKDIYEVTGAYEEGSLGQYLMYGLGSHALGVPIDFYSRGDMAVRNMTVVPTDVADFPSVAIISKTIGNIINTAQMIGQGAPTKEALLHGLAHNGMNRPLQGLGQIWLGYVSNGRGQKFFSSSNYIDYNAANDMNAGAMFARLLGSKPLNESIYMNEYYRKKDYQANMNDKLEKISGAIQLTENAGQSAQANWYKFATNYENIGGDPENFQAYFSRQLSRAEEPTIEAFRREMRGDNPLSRTQKRLLLEYSQKPVWEY